MALAPIAVAAAALADAASLYNERGNFVVSGENQNIQFPTDLSDAYINMRFSKYERRSIRNQPFLSSRVGIKLPLPSRLVDAQSLDYSPESLGPAYGAAAETVANAGNATLNTLPEQILQGITTGAAGAGAAAAQSVLPPRALGAISSVSGLAINPFQTMLFKSPNFKSHSFSWKLVPKNEDESNIIETIIRLFKYHSLPSVSQAGGVFFGFPDILELQLFPKDQYLYKFKPCVVDNVSVNYAPQGPSLYRGSRAPTAVELSISLKEIEIWTKADYFRSADGTVNDTLRQPNLTPGS